MGLRDRLRVQCWTCPSHSEDGQRLRGHTGTEWSTEKVRKYEKKILTKNISGLFKTSLTLKSIKINDKMKKWTRNFVGELKKSSIIYIFTFLRWLFNVETFEGI